MSNKKQTGIEMITQERKRQIEVEGWTPEHDNEHTNEELALAAVCYTMPSNYLEFQNKGMFDDSEFRTPLLWPWDSNWWKPSSDASKDSRIRDLVKAGALIAAEIDRLQNQ